MCLFLTGLFTFHCIVEVRILRFYAKPVTLLILIEHFPGFTREGLSQEVRKSVSLYPILQSNELLQLL